MASVAEEQDCVVTKECLYELIDFFATRGTQYKAKFNDKRYEVVEKMCLHLLARDYYVQSVNNSDGSLCPHYPAHLIILERDALERDKRKVVNDIKKLSEMFLAARSARCLCRFPVPVILFNKKNICRSSALSTAAELYGRSGLEWMTGKQTLDIDEEELPWQHERRPSEWGLVDQAREYDSQLISVLGVGLIIDLMVEMRKTSYKMTVASSEKADGSHWYSRYNIASMPYPGCEFFHKYRSHSKHSEMLQYDWSKPLNDAVLSIPSPLPESVGISYNEYQSWNVVKLTQNYLKLILHYLKFEDDGILVHCVGGWDRTPLYVSLIRLSLWADGVIHTSLKASEILYLTLAYDWFLFGHKFEERLRKCEEILYFCFDFLKHISTDEYSINTDSRQQYSTTTKSTDSPSTAADPLTTCPPDEKATEQLVNNSSTTTITTTSTSGTNGTTTIVPDGENDTRHSLQSTTAVRYTSFQDDIDHSLDNDVTKSLNKVSFDMYHGNCLYNPSVLMVQTVPTAPSSATASTIEGSPSVRTRQLLSVRELFITAYSRALPVSTTTSNDTIGDGGFVTTLFGRLTRTQ